MTKLIDGKPRWEGPGCRALPFVRSEWDAADLSGITALSPEACAESVERLAEQQNVVLLSQLLPSLLQAKGALGEHWPRIVYAASHMLVDGGGRDGFAKNWLEQTGHSPELAYQYASGAWNALVSTRPQIEVQRFIGAACVAGRIFEEYGGAPTGKIKDLSWFLLENSTPHRVQVLEEILRHKCPDGLPDAALSLENRSPVCIADRLALRQPTFLESIEKVYGLDHPVVGSQMRGAFMRALEATEANLTERSFWQSLQRWGDAPLAEAVMRGTFNVKSDNDEERTRVPMFEAVMNGAGPVLGRDIVQTVVMLGLDVNRAFAPHGERFIDVAVDRNDPELFSWLIARGADPELKSSHAEHPQSAVDRLGRKVGSFVPQVVEAAREMNDVLLTWRAHREAQRVIDALGDFRPNQHMHVQP